MKPKITTFLFALMILGAPFLKADAVFYPAASVANPLLAAPSSPRAMAMGDAGTALEGDLMSIGDNPASLARLGTDLEVSLQYALLDPTLGIFQDEFVIGSRVGPLGVLAASFDYFNLGSFTDFDNVAQITGSTSIYNAIGKLAWANTFFSDNLSLGLEGSYGAYYEGGNWGAFPDATLGLGWHLTKEWNLAASLNNLIANKFGSENEYFAVGAGYTPNAAFKVLADLYYPLNDVSAVRAGFEWRPVSYFALRAGWRQNTGGNDAELQNGPTAGIAATVKRIGLDYSYVSYGNGGPTHRIALTILFPASWIHEPAVVIETSGGTVAAKALYDQATAAQSKGNLLDALVDFKECLQAAAGFADAQQHIDGIVNQLAQNGTTASNNKEVQAVFDHYVQAGETYASSGELKKAIDTYEFALELDKKNIKVVEKLKAAQSQLETLIAQHMETGERALEGGDLDGAVKEFYAALNLDPQSDVAKNRLATLKPRILQEVKRLHRSGIDAYVDDHLDDAITAWKAALAIDPEDPENVNRDLLKAEKLKDLRK